MIIRDGQVEYRPQTIHLRPQFQTMDVREALERRKKALEERDTPKIPELGRFRTLSGTGTGTGQGQSSTHPYSDLSKYPLEYPSDMKASEEDPDKHKKGPVSVPPATTKKGKKGTVSLTTMLPGSGTVFDPSSPIPQQTMSDVSIPIGTDKEIKMKSMKELLQDLKEKKGAQDSNLPDFLKGGASAADLSWDKVDSLDNVKDGQKVYLTKESHNLPPGNYEIIISKKYNKVSNREETWWKAKDSSGKVHTFKYKKSKSSEKSDWWDNPMNPLSWFS